MDTILSCSGIEKTFEQPLIPITLLQDRLLRTSRHQSRWRVEALRGVSLEVQRGEWVGLYGPNGSGKTTLLRILAGLMQADRGSVVSSGSLLSFFDLSPGFQEECDADDNIYMYGLLHGLSPKDIKRMTDGIIDFSGLREHRSLPFKCYSLGMRLRLGFSMLAHLQADIYVFDEFFAVGDAAFRSQCMDHFRHMKANGKAVLMVTHEIADLRSTCDRLVFMEKGLVVGHEKVERSQTEMSDSLVEDTAGLVTSV